MQNAILALTGGGGGGGGILGVFRSLWGRLFATKKFNFKSSHDAGDDLDRGAVVINNMA